MFTNPITKKPYKEFKSTFKRTVSKAGIPHITFHELRHTTASRLNELGVDLSTDTGIFGSCRCKDNAEIHT